MVSLVIFKLGSFFRGKGDSEIEVCLDSMFLEYEEFWSKIRGICFWWKIIWVIVLKKLIIKVRVWSLEGYLRDGCFDLGLGWYLGFDVVIC